jgi:hypothetical protein
MLAFAAQFQMLRHRQGTLGRQFAVEVRHNLFL